MKVVLSIIVSGAVFLSATPFVYAKEKSVVDTAFVNGEVYTPSGWRSAVAIGNGKIIATGNDQQIRKLVSSQTKIHDLKGKTVFPGLYDMHVHPMMASNDEEGECKIPQGVDADALLAIVAQCTKSKKPGEWVTGGQWQASSMAATPITSATLDTASPHNPVMLFDISGHSVWANSRALKIAGITKETVNPEGGIIERDNRGEPTGVLRETARQLVMMHVPQPSAEDNVVALEKSLDLMLSYGIVGLLDAMVLSNGLEAYRSLADKGGLKQVVKACMAYSVAGKVEASFTTMLEKREEYASKNFRPDCIKVFADGVPTESHTGAMVEPYEDHQPNAPEKGLLLFNTSEMNQLVRGWDKQNLTVMFHAAGDAAVRASLDAIEFARKENGMNGPRHQVGHATFITREDIPRAKALNATIEFSPYLWYPSPINDDITKAIGAKRIERVWPIKDAIDAGGIVVAGSDWPVVPSPDPWLAIETSITRQPVGGGDSFGGGQGITLEQSVAMFSIQAAKQMGIEKERGTIEADKFADLIVLDRNPFKIPATEIHKVKVLQTYIEGQLVYEGGN